MAGSSNPLHASENKSNLKNVGIQSCDDTEENTEETCLNEEQKKQARKTLDKLEATLKFYGQAGNRKNDIPVEDQKFLLARIATMREETLLENLSKGYGLKPSSSKTCSEDFDVAHILKTSLIEEKGNDHIKHDEDFYRDLFKPKHRSYGPSGLIQTRKVDNIKKRLGDYSRTSVSAVPVSAHTHHSASPYKPYRRPSTQVAECKEIKSGYPSRKMYCGICRMDVETLVTYEQGLFSILSAVICCIVVPILIPCVWIPFLFYKFMDKKFTCPKCGSTLGIFKRV